MKKTALFFSIIFIEGYVVLACELLAIRSLIPFVGSGTETISIIISAVLLPLAIGYHAGGDSFQRSYNKGRRKGKIVTVRKILLKNISYALIFLAFGLSYPFLEIFFDIMMKLGIKDRMLQTTIYSIIFLVIPVYKLGQTVPLVSNYFSSKNLSAITGKMLFFSTTGSFFGSIFSTIILMTFLGVHITVIITLLLLASLVPVLFINHKWDASMVRTIMAVGVVIMFNNNIMMKALHVVSNNRYNIVTIIKDPTHSEDKIFDVNRSASSKWSTNPERAFAYVKYIEDTFIAPIKQSPVKKDILIIGAGGFTMGYEDENNNYTYIDIDAKLKEDAEKYFLPGKLKPNKKFIPSSARAFIHNTNDKFDLIIVDTYTNIVSIPMETVTSDFLQDVKNHLKTGGAVVANIISSPTFKDKFSIRYDNTFRSVFPNYTRQIADKFSGWGDEKEPKVVNALYIYYDLPADDTVYTDDKNSYSLDR